MDLNTKQHREKQLGTGDCYQDFAFMQPHHISSRTATAGSFSQWANQHFPIKLQYMLSEMEKDGMQDVMSWATHGRCFHIHDPKYLEKNVLPLYVNNGLSG